MKNIKVNNQSTMGGGIYYKIIRRIKKIFLPMEEYAKFLGVVVGDNCDIAKDVEFGSEPYLIEIGNNVRLTRGVSFITHDGGVWVLRNLKKRENDTKIDVFGRIKIGNNVHIGWNAIIMKGVTIGDNCIIGAGAIVTKDVEDNTVVAGVPAKKLKTIDEYYEKVLTNCDYTKSMSSSEKKAYLIKKYNLK